MKTAKVLIPEGLFDLKQAAAYMGKQLTTVHNYVRAERLPRAEKIGGKVYVRQDDCDRLKAEVEGWAAGRQGQKLLPDGRKMCSKCKTVKTIVEFCRQPNAPTGRSSQCTKCQSEKTKIWFDQRSQDPEFREKRLAYKRQYRQENKAKIRAYKSDYEKRIRLENKPGYAKRKAYHREHHRVLTLCERIESPLKAARKSAQGKRFGFFLIGRPATNQPQDFRTIALGTTFTLERSEAVLLRCRPSQIQPGKFTFEAWHELDTVTLDAWKPVAKRLQELEFGIRAEFRKKLKRRRRARVYCPSGRPRKASDGKAGTSRVASCQERKASR